MPVSCVPQMMNRDIPLDPGESSSVSSAECMRVFSTSMLHRAETAISRGTWSTLTAFHLNEVKSTGLFDPTEVAYSSNHFTCY